MVNTSNILTDAVAHAFNKMPFLTVMTAEESLTTYGESFLSEMNFTGPANRASQYRRKKWMTKSSFC
jgi:hypothetical protein